MTDKNSGGVEKGYRMELLGPKGGQEPQWVRKQTIVQITGTVTEIIDVEWTHHYYIDNIHQMIRIQLFNK